MAVGELLSLAIEAGRDATTVRLAGELDLSTATELRECLVRLERDVVVDFTEVSFVDSQGIGLLLAEHHRRASRGERLVVHGASAMMLRTLEITGGDMLLELDGDSPQSQGPDAPAESVA